LFDALHALYGEQPWWPADSAFEVVVGAVLTQNAAWSNVEKAIDRLKKADLLSLQALLESDHDTLAEAIRPSGYFNIKAKRLRNLCEFLARQGGLDAFSTREPDAQREALLGVNGVGPETADDILLYAMQQPVFVLQTSVKAGDLAADEPSRIRMVATTADALHSPLLHHDLEGTGVRTIHRASRAKCSSRHLLKDDRRCSLRYSISGEYCRHEEENRVNPHCS